MKLTSKQENALRALYVKALRLANGEPTEVEEIRHLYSEVLKPTSKKHDNRFCECHGEYKSMPGITTTKD